MTPEQLMIPRYKVIADYPKSFYTLGQVIECDEPDHQLAQWPAIFKPLQWWEDRKVEEMPEYVKLKTNSRFWQVDKWHRGLVSPFFYAKSFGTELVTISCDHLIPATESEYTTYINSKK